MSDKRIQNEYNFQDSPNSQNAADGSQSANNPQNAPDISTPIYSQKPAELVGYKEGPRKSIITFDSELKIKEFQKSFETISLPSSTWTQPEDFPDNLSSMDSSPSRSPTGPTPPATDPNSPSNDLQSLSLQSIQSNRPTQYSNQTVQGQASTGFTPSSVRSRNNSLESQGGQRNPGNYFPPSNQTVQDQQSSGFIPSSVRPRNNSLDSQASQRNPPNSVPPSNQTVQGQQSTGFTPASVRPRNNSLDSQASQRNNPGNSAPPSNQTVQSQQSNAPQNDLQSLSLQSVQSSKPTQSSYQTVQGQESTGFTPSLVRPRNNSLESQSGQRKPENSVPSSYQTMQEQQQSNFSNFSNVTNLPSQNRERGDLDKSASVTSVAQRNQGYQSQASSQLNGGQSNQGYDPTQSSSQAYDAPSNQGYPPQSSSQAYDAPNNQGYLDKSASQTSVAQRNQGYPTQSSSQVYDAPSNQGYSTQSSSQGYDAPSNQGYLDKSASKTSVAQRNQVYSGQVSSQFNVEQSNQGYPAQSFSQTSVAQSNLGYTPQSTSQPFEAQSNQGYSAQPSSQIYDQQSNQGYLSQPSNSAIQTQSQVSTGFDPSLTRSDTVQQTVPDYMGNASLQNQGSAFPQYPSQATNQEYQSQSSTQIFGGQSNQGFPTQPLSSQAYPDQSYQDYPGQPDLQSVVGQSNQGLSSQPLSQVFAEQSNQGYPVQSSSQGLQNIQNQSNFGPQSPGNEAELIFQSASNQSVQQTTYKLRKSPPTLPDLELAVPEETKADREWMGKLEQFSLKFLDRTFWRKRHERRLAEAVKIPNTCKKPAGFVPTANAGVFPYSHFAPLQGFEESIVDDAIINDADEEAQNATEINTMIDEIKQVIPTISPSFLPQVTQLLQGTLMNLRNVDFRNTDNREIFRRIDDYAALIRCDEHICMEPVRARLAALVEFVNTVKQESERLKKFPRILTKCYSTESKICQEVCEVYSDDEFQTVNIKKMCKLKPKPLERPPWRLSYKMGRECYPGYDMKLQACTAPTPPQKKCAGEPTTCSTAGPSTCGGVGPNTCGSAGGNAIKKNSGCCDDALEKKSQFGKTCKKKMRKVKSSCCQPQTRWKPPCRTSRRRKDCPCGCCSSTDFVPDICGIRFTRFRAIDVEECPLMIEGHPTDVAFPSVTNFKNIRELEIPSQKLFTCEPKCNNPLPCHARDHCFGTGGGAKWKNKQYPCGAKNFCKKESCKAQCDSGSCCKGKRKRQKKKKKCAATECGTSMTNLPGIGRLRVPPGVNPKEFKEIMTDFYGSLVERAGNNFVGTGTCKDGIKMKGLVATQTQQCTDKNKLEQELNQRQQEEKRLFDEKVKKQREEFAEQQKKKWQNFEGQQSGKPFEQVQSTRRMMDEEMGNERRRFEEGIAQQLRDLNAKQEEERKQLEQQGGGGTGPSKNWQVQNRSPDGRYNFTQMSLQASDNITKGFRNMGFGQTPSMPHGQQTQGGFLSKQLSSTTGTYSKQQQTFRPYEEFKPITGDELQAELQQCLKTTNNTFVGCLAQIAPTGDGPGGEASAKQKEEVYSGFIAQMLAAGNITKDDATKMTNLVKSRLQPSAGEETRCCTRTGAKNYQKEAQCTLAKTAHKDACCREKTMHVCSAPHSGCPHSTLRGYSTPAKIFATTRTFQSPSRCQMNQTRGWQKPDGTYDAGMLCMSAAKPACVPTCPKPPPVKCKSHTNVPVIRSPPACKVKSFPMIFKRPQCPIQDWIKPECCTFSPPKIPAMNTDNCVYQAKIEPVAPSKIEIPEPEPEPEIPPPPPPFNDPSPPESLTKSPTDKSLSLTSLSPSSPQSVVAISDESPPPEPIPPPPPPPPPPPKIRRKPPDCESSWSKLPECHPLKTPYPPQYRFDEVRMRRYQEQCGLLKQICARPPGEQCWTPPPPPLPPHMRARKPPFPPDPCAPNLFPGANLGMGCGYGLSAGSCYGPFGNKRQPPKPEDCFFDCGGICPMGLLGEQCPEPKIPVYSKLKKKQKEDEYFTFDYITVMREKNPKPEEQQDYCDLYKQKKEGQCCEMEGQNNARRMKRSRGRNDCNANEPPCPDDDIAKFLNRPGVQMVKEQKTAIIKKHGCEGPEKMVQQMEAYYTKTNDGRITATNPADPRNLGDDQNANMNSVVEQWIKQDAEATMKRHNRANNFGSECPMRETDWEKEFKEFSKSCRRPKCKPKGPNLKPLPAGFIPCPLPDTPAPIMCRVEDTKNMTGGGTIQCQVIPFPLTNVIGNTLGPDGRCPLTMSVPPFGMPPPPGSYGGYVMGQNQNGAQGVIPNQGQMAQGFQQYSGGSVMSGGISVDPGPGSSKYSPSQQALQGVGSQKNIVNNTKKDDYPFMCEIKYHQPIQGSIYGRVVSRKQPCRLIDPDSGIPPNHNPECPVIMETPYFNPSCPQKNSNAPQPSNSNINNQLQNSNISNQNQNSNIYSKFPNPNINQAQSSNINNQFQNSSISNQNQRSNINNQAQSSNFNNQNQRSNLNNQAQSSNFNNQFQNSSINNQNQRSNINNQVQSSYFNNQYQNSNINNQVQSSNLNNQNQRSNTNNQAQSSNFNNQIQSSNFNNQNQRSNVNNQAQSSNFNNQYQNSNVNSQFRNPNQNSSIQNLYNSNLTNQYQNQTTSSLNSQSYQNSSNLNNQNQTRSNFNNPNSNPSSSPFNYNNPK